MAEQERIKENLRKNEPFITAFDYFADMFTNGSQKDMAVLIGTKSPRISEYRKGKCPVHAEVINGLIRFSAEKKMQIYSEYLYGHSDIMLLANVTDEEINDAKRRAMNPDYDVIQARLKEKEKQLDAYTTQNLPYIDPSSQMNATIAAQMKTIEVLEDQLSEKDARIAELKDTIAAKEETIKARDARIADLERQLAAAATSDLSRYPYIIGTAEDHKQTKSL